MKRRSTAKPSRGPPSVGRSGGKVHGWREKMPGRGAPARSGWTAPPAAAATEGRDFYFLPAGPPNGLLPEAPCVCDSL